MTAITVNWSSLKDFVDQRSSSIQWLDINDNYYLFAYDGQFSISCLIPKQTPASSDQDDFESNYKSKGNISPNAVVTTQYEMNDKDLKLARISLALSGSNTGSTSIKVPGTFGSIDGRYVAGGYAISEDYNKDDYIVVRVEDTDRLIALEIAKASDPSATLPVSDATVQALGTFPSYPIVKSYTDGDAPSENQGWYFWPLAMGNNISPVGECEVEPIGGYAFMPAGMYLVLTYVRPVSVTTGGCKVNIYWGKKE